jgi:iron complex transport system ATP-binding protein
MTVCLQAESLTIGYQDIPLLSQWTQELRAGEMVCLLGANGVGKSTLMRTLTGMQAALAGSVLIEGRPIDTYPRRELARRLGIVLTERIQAPLFTAYEVVSLGRYPHTGWAGTLAPHDHSVVEESLAAAGAAELADRYLSELSVSLAARLGPLLAV